MPLPMHPDGCIISNTPVYPFTMTYIPVCEHTKLRYAEITILAESMQAAMHFAERWIKLPQMRVLCAGPERT